MNSIFKIVSFIAVSCLLSITVAVAQFSDEQWDNRFGIPGTVRPIHAIVANGNELYIGGAFNTAGTMPAFNIVRWDGERWSVLGKSLGYQGVDGPVNAIAINGDNVYVVGQFSRAGDVQVNNIAVWNRSTNTWSALGDGVGDPGTEYLSAITLNGNDVYVGGSFTVAGSKLANNVAKWNGSSWDRLDVGIDGIVSVMATANGAVYVGGDFASAGGKQVSNIARWSGTQWTTLDGGADAPVHSFCVSGGKLYVGGKFSTVGSGVNTHLIAMLDPVSDTWSALGTGLPSSTPNFSSTDVTAIAKLGNTIYVGGKFYTDWIPRQTISSNLMYQWDGTSWRRFDSIAGNSISPLVQCMTVQNDELVIAGDFSNVHLAYGYNVARWNGTTWSGIGTGLYAGGSAMATDGTNIYVGSDVANTLYDNIEKSSRGSVTAGMWDGTKWHVLEGALGGGNGFAAVRAIAHLPSSGMIYAGTFSTASSQTVNNVALYNNGTWSALGQGVNGAVNAVAVQGDEVFVAGAFTQAGGSSAGHLAIWNSSTQVWTPIASGPDGVINAVSVDGNLIYVGGSFKNAGGVSTKNVAVYDRSAGTWSPLGSGVEGTVYAIAARPGAKFVYVGGDFAGVGSGDAGNFAVWDKTSWNTVSGGVNGPVYTVKYDGSIVIVGGDFTQTGDGTANHIAQWTQNGGWKAWGSGTNNIVRSLTGINNDIYLGGDFTYAGGIPSYRFARYNRFTASVDSKESDDAVHSFTIAPNPVSVQTIAELSLSQPSLVRYELVNILGASVMSSQPRMYGPGENRIPINVESLPNGIYICRLHVGNRITSQRISICH